MEVGEARIVGAGKEAGIGIMDGSGHGKFAWKQGKNGNLC